MTRFHNRTSGCWQEDGSMKMKECVGYSYQLPFRWHRHATFGKAEPGPRDSRLSLRANAFGISSQRNNRAHSVSIHVPRSVNHATRRSTAKLTALDQCQRQQSQKLKHCDRSAHHLQDLFYLMLQSPKSMGSLVSTVKSKYLRPESKMR